MSSSGATESDVLYDDEAAQNAFFNAPRVTIRNNRRSKGKTKEVDDEEESEPVAENYDENVDKELNERIAQHLKDFFAKKVTAKNAFETPILDKLPAVAEMEPLQCVGAMLDASARVYAFRVDNTHCECFNVRTNFDEAKKKKIRDDISNDEDDGREGKVTGNDGEDSAEADDENGDADGDVAVDGGLENGTDGAKAKKKKGLKQGTQDAELNGLLDELNRQSEKLISRFAKHVLPAVNHTAQAAEPLSVDTILEGFERYASRMQDVIMARRVGVPFIEQKMHGLNRTVEEFSIDDPIYHKVAKQFEEGCAQSFVNNEVLTNRDGSLLILHTNWCNDDPFGTHNKPLADELIGRPNNSQFFTSIEGSLVRALSTSPSNLPLLQEFCEDDEDDRKVNETAEADSSGVRQLGRKSQDAARISDSVTVMGAANSHASAGRLSVDGLVTTEDGDGHASESSSFSLTEEEREHREHEELAKFQMYLDENVDMKSEPLCDPFDNLNFFSDNFAHLMASESKAGASADAEKAVLHYLSDADANTLGVSLSVLSEIKSVMKPGRAVPSPLLTKLSSSLAPANLAQFRMLVDVDALGVEGTADDVFNASMSSFLVTRFAPLIDSIWHSVIKSADEEDLARANVFVGGVRNAQRALSRQLHHQAHLQRSARRRRAHVAPSTPTSTATPPQFTRSRLGESSSQDVVISPPKRQRLGATSASQSVVDEEEENDEFTQISEFTMSSTARSVKERIYFWARPRRYPIVYFGQIIDDRDGPMNHGVEMFVDIEEMLLGMDENNRLSQINKEIVEEVASPDSIKTDVNDANDNDTVLEDFGDYLANGNDEPPVEFLFDQPLTVDSDQLADVLNDAIIGDDLLENNELGNTKPNALREPTPEDQSHWRGGAVAEDGQPLAAVEASVKEKKTKKKPVNKAKRRRLISDLNAEMGGSLTGEMLWQSIDDMDATVMASIARHQSSVENALDLVHKIDGYRRANEPKLFLDRGDFALDFSGHYDPLQLIKSSLLFDNHCGFWRFEKKKDAKSEAKFYECPCEHKTPSMDDQSNEFLALFFRDRMPPPVVKEADEATANAGDHYTNFDPYDLGAPASLRGDAFDDDYASVGGGDSDGELGGLARLDKPPLVDGDVDMKLMSVPNVELQQEEQLEFNGGIIKIRQSRVKAPLVKRAIALILSSSEMDLKSLNNKRSKYASKRRGRRNSDKENRSGEANPDGAEPTSEIMIGNNELDGMSSDEEDDVKMISQFSSSSSEDEEEVLSSNPAPNVFGVKQMLNTTTASDVFAVRGEHTFESLLTNLPQHLSGRTKHDLNVINAFAITLHMCNEQQMHLLQDKDEETLLVKPKAMSTFKFQLSDN